MNKIRGIDKLYDNLFTFSENNLKQDGRRLSICVFPGLGKTTLVKAGPAFMQSKASQYMLNIIDLDFGNIIHNDLIKNISYSDKKIMYMITQEAILDNDYQNCILTNNPEVIYDIMILPTPELYTRDVIVDRINQRDGVRKNGFANELKEKYFKGIIDGYNHAKEMKKKVLGVRQLPNTKYLTLTDIILNRSLLIESNEDLSPYQNYQGSILSQQIVAWNPTYLEDRPVNFKKPQDKNLWNVKGYLTADRKNKLTDDVLYNKEFK